MATYKLLSVRDIPQTFEAETGPVHEVDVDLGGGDVYMPEQVLDGAPIA